MRQLIRRENVFGYLTSMFYGLYILICAILARYVTPEEVVILQTGVLRLIEDSSLNDTRIQLETVSNEFLSLIQLWLISAGVLILFMLGVVFLLEVMQLYVFALYGSVLTLITAISPVALFVIYKIRVHDVIDGFRPDLADWLSEEGEWQAIFRQNYDCTDSDVEGDCVAYLLMDNSLIGDCVRILIAFTVICGIVCITPLVVELIFTFLSRSPGAQPKRKQTIDIRTRKDSAGGENTTITAPIQSVQKRTKFVVRHK